MMIAGQPGRGGRLPETKPRSAGAAAPARVPPVAAVSSRRPFSQPENRTSGSRRERIRAIPALPCTRTPNPVTRCAVEQPVATGSRAAVASS